MKSLDKLPTPENLVATIQEDALGRNIFIQNFIRLLTSIKGHYSIALDGRWGSGKTFFVKQTEQVIRQLFRYKKEFKKYYEIDDNPNIYEKFKELFANDKILAQPMVSLYYDAWQHDNQQDALLSLIFELVKIIPTKDYRLKLKPSAIDITQSTLVSIANEIVKKSSSIFTINGDIHTFEGIDSQKISQDIENNLKNLLSPLKDQEELDKLINKYLNSILPPEPTRLVIFIDELDRCKPDYAVQLLERVKHYMNSERITFVFSVNYDQLQHTIKRYYGDKFEASKYLDKFFDLHVKLPFADLTKRREAFLFDKNADSTFNKWCQILVEEFKLEIREIIHLQELIKQTIYTYDDIFDKYRSNPSEFQNGIYGTLAFLNYFFAPLALVFFIKDINLYYEFIDGKNEKLIDKLNEYIEIFPLDFLVDIFTVDTTKNTEEQIKEIQNDFYTLYDILFSTNDHRYGGVMYMNLPIDDSIKLLFVNQISLLSITKNY